MLYKTSLCHCVCFIKSISMLVASYFIFGTVLWARDINIPIYRWEDWVEAR